MKMGRACIEKSRMNNKDRNRKLLDRKATTGKTSHKIENYVVRNIEAVISGIQRRETVEDRNRWRNI